MNAKIVFVLIVCIFLSSCAPSRRFTGKTGKVSAKSYGTLIGYATYYGPGFHGNKTASGEVFDMYKMTCAHRTLPFGTILLVTNLSNSKSVQVRVNDRGPFVKNVIIDLSLGSAKKIDLDGKEMVEVKIMK
ncbi:MAG: septal ring lytic transglycosylase RlpA family protein [Candidatus Cloacimonadota bacterium]|jgi:rare lipoprotein A|nr:MAG: septal ring lytic transglycosylase RlpA family protein [Candidatus Cloacimonadota bacterium]